MTDMLKVQSLVKCFGALRATDDASFDVRTGEVHALIGPNGAGKTTLIHQISGALAPTSGRIVFDGQDVAHQDMPQRVRAGLVRSYQITSIFKRFSVRDNLVLALQARRDAGQGGWVARFWQPVLSDRAVQAEAQALAERIGLASQLDRISGALAHGEQRQLELGLALAARPRLLLLDEPMAGMGPDESARMVSLLQQLRQDMTLLLVEHDMAAVFQLADRISTLVNGRVIATGTPDEIRAHPEVRRAYLGDELGESMEEAA